MLRKVFMNRIFFSGLAARVVFSLLCVRGSSSGAGCFRVSGSADTFLQDHFSFHFLNLFEWDSAF